MKKKFLSILLVLCLITFVTGCGEAKPNSTGENTSTGTNTSSGDNKGPSGYTPLELEKNIVTSGAVAKNGKLMVFATNNNKVPVDMKIEVEFYTEDGTIAGSGSEDFQGVGANCEVATEIYGTPDKWDNYKIYADVEETDVSSYVDKVEVKHSNNKKNIVVQVTNNSESDIDYIEVAVVYYQGETPVGLEDGLQSDTKPGRSANFNIYFASDKKYNDVKFDTYKVFVNEAYSYNW